MTNGDLASSHGMETVPGEADRRMGYDEINLTRDYVAQEIDNRTAAVAGKANTAHTHAAADITSGTSAGPSGNTLVKRNSAGDFAVNTPTAGTHPATKDYCDANNSGGTTSTLANGPTSSAYSRNTTGSGWYAVWMNSSNQFMRNTSSRRYKEAIKPLDVAHAHRVLGLEPVTYHRKGQPADTREVGLIAEQCVDVPGLVAFDYPRDRNGDVKPGTALRPEAVRYETVLPVYLLALLQEQQRELIELRDRVEALEHGK